MNLKLRYSILKSYYREFINKKGSGSIYKPLFLQFPMDSTTYNDDISETEFMIGKMLLGAPIV